MDPVSIASIVVAAIAALSAVASQRSAARAAITNTAATTRVDMEKEAYERARAYDTETIRRQDEELAELRLDNKNLYAEIKILRQRINRLELGLQANLEELLNERLAEPHPPEDGDPEQPGV